MGRNEKGGDDSSGGYVVRVRIFFKPLLYRQSPPRP